MPDETSKRRGRHTASGEPELNAGVVPADRLRMREAIKEVSEHAEAEKVEEHLKHTGHQEDSRAEPARKTDKPDGGR
jgi:hypothetical protein